MGQETTGFVLPGEPQPGSPAEQKRNENGGTTDLHQHLQAMFALLQPHHLLKEAVKLESAHPNRSRYLAVVACAGSKEAAEEEETCVLGEPPATMLRCWRLNRILPYIID